MPTPTAAPPAPRRPPTAAEEPTVLIVEPDVLIADDLAETVVGAAPGVRVVGARDADEALEAMRGTPRLAAAFLRLPAEELARGAVPDAAEARGAQVVVLDEPSAASREGWLHTGRPWRADAIVSVLRRFDLG